jgi:Lrp/AsnC family transcriptional regulator, regulator for asnA, asnC and gidA
MEKHGENLEIDGKDLQILEILKKNSRTPFLEIARSLGVSGATIHERVGRMRADEIIEGFTINLNKKKLGYNILALIGVTLEHPLDDTENLREELKSIPEVIEAHNMTGNTDLSLKIRTRDMDELRDLLVNKIQRITGVKRINTSIVLDSPVERTETIR